jgi:WD40 repeat protein
LFFATVFVLTLAAVAIGVLWAFRFVVIEPGYATREAWEETRADLARLEQSVADQRRRQEEDARTRAGELAGLAKILRDDLDRRQAEQVAALRKELASLPKADPKPLELLQAAVTELGVAVKDQDTRLAAIRRAIDGIKPGEGPSGDDLRKEIAALKAAVARQPDALQKAISDLLRTLPETPADKLPAAVKALQTALDKQSEALAALADDVKRIRPGPGVGVDPLKGVRDDVSKLKDAQDRQARELERVAERLAEVIKLLKPGPLSLKFDADRRQLVTAAAFSADGRLLAAAGQNGRIRLWDARGGTPAGEPLVVSGGGSVSDLAFAPDGKVLAAACSDGKVRRWEMPAGKALSDIDHGGGKVHCVSYSPDGTRLASGGTDEIARVWDAETGKLLARTGKHDNTVYALAFSPDGRTLAAAARRSVRLWDAGTGKADGVPLEGHESLVLSVAFSPLGGVLATSDHDGTVRLWDVKRRQSTDLWNGGGRGPANRIAFSPGGTVVGAGFQNGEMLFRRVVGDDDWRGADGPRGGSVRALAFDHKGRRLAGAGADGVVDVRVYLTDAGELARGW